MPFYKVENDYLVSATNIDGLGFSLSETSKDEYTYPIAGWSWFVDLPAAMDATGKAPAAEYVDDMYFGTATPQGVVTL